MVTETTNLFSSNIDPKVINQISVGNWQELYNRAIRNKENPTSFDSTIIQIQKLDPDTLRLLVVNQIQELQEVRKYKPVEMENLQPIFLSEKSRKLEKQSHNDENLKILFKYGPLPEFSDFEKCLDFLKTRGKERKELIYTPEKLPPLAGIPNEIFTYMTELEEISFSRNQISTIPEGFQNLKKLTKLDLSNNKIVDFSKIPSLKILKINGNPGIPTEEFLRAFANSGEGKPTLVLDLMQMRRCSLDIRKIQEEIHSKKKVTVSFFWQVVERILNFIAHPIGKILRFIRKVEEVQLPKTEEEQPRKKLSKDQVVFIVLDGRGDTYDSFNSKSEL
ncbi:MAG: leucine-rich repeat domain-containing protein [Chlamydiae bacterium]|nr:leucine-rich repeat domain-containing protein [Chlamydiota bacterium]